MISRTQDEKLPIAQGKQALTFLKWLIREVEAEYPAATTLSGELKSALISIDSFVNFRDDKKILKIKPNEFHRLGSDPDYVLCELTWTLCIERRGGGDCSKCARVVEKGG